MEEQRITHSPKETQQYAKEFAKNLKGGDIIALYGDLGAGKTTFVQGLASGVGIQRRIISPTFVIVRTYELRSKNQELRIKRFYHIDLYRIETERDLEGLGIKEILSDTDTIVVIEWAEKLGKLLPKKRWELYFDYLGNDKRKITIQKIQP